MARKEHNGNHHHKTRLPLLPSSSSSSRRVSLWTKREKTKETSLQTKLFFTKAAEKSRRERGFDAKKKKKINQKRDHRWEKNEQPQEMCVCAFSRRVFFAVVSSSFESEIFCTEEMSQDRHYSFDFWVLSSHALTHTAAGGFIYTTIKTNTQSTYHHGVSRCLLVVLLFSLLALFRGRPNISSRSELCQHTTKRWENFALQSADCSHLKKKKKTKKKKNKNVLGARAFLFLFNLFGLLLLCLFCNNTPGKSAEEEAENRLKRSFRCC